MATFPLVSSTDGDKGLKGYEWRCQGLKRRFTKPKYTREDVKKDSIRYMYFAKKFWKFWT